MPYITKEEVAAKRKELKKAFPNVKFSITRQNHSMIAIAILSSSFAFDLKGRDYQTVNHFYVGENYKDLPEQRDFLQKVIDIAKNGQRTLCEDGDYGTVPTFYVDVTIGKWDKPYQVK